LNSPENKNLIKGAFFNKYTLNYFNDDKCIGANIISGWYEPYETSLLLSNIDSGDIIIDVGANIGYYTIIFADKVGPSGKVYAFEPDPANFSLLKKNIEENKLYNIEAVNGALGSRIGSSDLYISWDNYGDHRLYQDQDNYMDLRLYKNEKARNHIKVKCDTLDNYLFRNNIDDRKIKLIKIDTQGYEPYVIEGAKNTICKNKPIVFLEYWSFGFKNSGGNGDAMFEYLKKEYGGIYFIDENNKKAFKTDREYVNEYCMQYEGTMHCNLLCKNENIIK